MKLREYQAKKIFAQYGLAVPRGIVVRSVDAARAAANTLNTSVVLKPQLGVKGRGKVGGIAFAHTPDEAASHAARLFGMTIKDEPVQTLLVQEMVDITQELYIAVTVDYNNRCPVMIASSEGGVDIEETAAKTPEKIFRIPVDILTGKANLLHVTSELGADVAAYLETLYTIFRDTDAELLEINPLARDENGRLSVVDAVLNINEDSVSRHPELDAFKQDIPAEDPFSLEAAQQSWTYISLDGDIGILSSGAGLTMTILDLLNGGGGKPANFLDTAQIDADGVYDAFDFLARAKKVNVILVNIFAGLNRCDKLALGIARYFRERSPNIPVIVRMAGNKEAEGHAILRDAGITPFTELEDAVAEAVNTARENRS